MYNNHLLKKIVLGRGRRTRTLTGGFGDRCATINTIPLYLKHSYNISIKIINYQDFFKKILTFFLFDNKIYVLTNKQKNVSKQLAKNNNVCIVAYDNKNWIRINCKLIDDSNNIDAKKAVLSEFEWAEEAGYTLDNPDFQVLYISDADSTIYDEDGNVIESYNF